MAIFPDKMMESGSLNLDSVKAKLNFFELQLHELHWQTTSFAEHEAIGDLYGFVFNVKDNIVEKMMGYTGQRTKAMPVDPIKNYSPGYTRQVVRDLCDFAYQLMEYAGKNKMCDIENIAQELSGAGAKTLYRLTLS